MYIGKVRHTIVKINIRLSIRARMWGITFCGTDQDAIYGTYYVYLHVYPPFILPKPWDYCRIPYDTATYRQVKYNLNICCIIFFT